MRTVIKIKAGLVLAATIFWIPIFITFFQNRGFSLSEVYFLVTVFSIAVVIFEYPTGVIGDHFSHKASVQLGYLILAIGTLLSVLRIPQIFYFFILIIQALGASLSSGSDIALLHSVSTDFKKDVSDVKSAGLIMLLVGTVTGGFLGKYNTDFPIILTALFSFAGFIFISSVPTVKQVTSEQSNIFSKAKDGLKFVKANSLVLYTLILGAVFGAFLFSVKWFYNTIFLDLAIKESLWGVFASISLFCTAVGAIIYRKRLSLNTGLLSFTIIAIIFLMGLFESAFFVLAALFLYSLFQGFFEVEYEQLINKQVPDGIRASVLSLKSLTLRVIYAIYTFAAGVMLKRMTLAEFLILTALVMLAITIPLWKSIRTVSHKT